MRHALGIVVAALLSIAVPAHAAPPATAPAERFTGAQTVLALEADSSKVDANDAARWACNVLLAMHAADEKDLAQGRDNAAVQQAWCSRWISDFRAAAGGGACTIIGVTESEWILDGGFALYVPVPAAGDVERVEEVLGGGPAARRRKQAQPRHRFDWHTDVKIWPGRIVGYCVGATQAPPAPNEPHRPQFAEAFASTGEGAAAAPAAARIVLVPDAKMREQFEQNTSPAAWRFIEPMRWLLIRYDAAPLPLKVPSKLTVTYRARDAAAAGAIAAAWEELIEKVYAAAGLEAAEVQQIVHRLRPTVDSERVVLSIAADELPQLIADARPSIRKAWRVPKSDRSKSARGGGIEVGYH